MDSACAVVVPALEHGRPAAVWWALHERANQLRDRANQMATAAADPMQIS